MGLGCRANSLAHLVVVHDGVKMGNIKNVYSQEDTGGFRSFKQKLINSIVEKYKLNTGIPGQEEYERTKRELDEMKQRDANSQYRKARHRTSLGGYGGGYGGGGSLGEDDSINSKLG